eukprot:jgi/Undpi1/14220/HiC_scaffold_9.g03869.m1
MEVRSRQDAKSVCIKRRHEAISAGEVLEEVCFVSYVKAVALIGLRSCGRGEKRRRGGRSLVASALSKIDWQIVGGFWVGFMAWGAGITGTCVSTFENSGGLPTALFFIQSAMSLVAATLSLVLVDGLAYRKVRESGGNCLDVSSCTDNTCASYDCVCWDPDGSAGCREGTSHRMCLTYHGDCDELGDSEPLLAASTFIHWIIITLACVAILSASATCCFCKYTVLLRREQGVTQIHRL